MTSITMQEMQSALKQFEIVLTKEELEVLQIKTLSSN